MASTHLYTSWVPITLGVWPLLLLKSNFSRARVDELSNDSASLMKAYNQKNIATATPGYNIKIRHKVFPVAIRSIFRVLLLKLPGNTAVSLVMSIFWTKLWHLYIPGTYCTGQEQEE